MGTEGTLPAPLERGISRNFLGRKKSLEGRARGGHHVALPWLVTGLVALVAFQPHENIPREEQGWGGSGVGNEGCWW